MATHAREYMTYVHTEYDICVYTYIHIQSRIRYCSLLMSTYGTYWLSPSAVNIGVVLEGRSIRRHPHENIQVALVIIDCCRLDYRRTTTAFCEGVFGGEGWREGSLWLSR